MKGLWRLVTLLVLLSVPLFFEVNLATAEEKKPPTANETEGEEEQLFDKLFGSGPQESDYWRADRLLLTATGSQVPVFKAPSVASMITKEEIEAMGATTLDEILETVPGLHVYPSGLNIFCPIWSIRGIQSKINPQALLLMNGIPLTQNYNGGRPWVYRMPVSMISRVEIVRGPGSAVHGADAFSGVINVITKDNFEIDGTRIGGRYGSFETYDVWLQHGGQYKGWDIWGGIEVQDSEGDHDRIIEKDYMDAMGLSAFSNTPGYLGTEYTVIQTNLGIRKDNVTFQFFGSWRDSAMGPGGLQAITYGNDVDETDLMFDLTWRDKNFTSDWDLSLRLYYLYMNADAFYQFFPSGFPNKMLGNPILVDNNGGIEVTAFYERFNRHNLRFSTGFKAYDTETDQNKNFGAGITNQFGPLVNVGNTPFVFMEDQDRQLVFASIQDEWYITTNLTFTGGVRVDHYSDFGTTINPRAALVWETTYFLTTKLLYGRAFRAPSFGEQYVQNNVVVDGNPNVDPETIDTYELAFDLQPTKDLHGIVSFFYYEAQDLIDAVGSGGPVPVFQNTGEQEGHGFEIELEWDIIDTLKVRSNFAYQRSKNKITDELVPDAPEMQFYLNPHWKFAENWSLDGQYYWIGEQHRAVGDPRENINDYDLVNLTLRRKNIIENLDVALAVRNLFDEDARTPSIYDPNAPEGAYIPDDYPIEGRSFWLEISYKL